MLELELGPAKRATSSAVTGSNLDLALELLLALDSPRNLEQDGNHTSSLALRPARGGSRVLGREEKMLTWKRC